MMFRAGLPLLTAFAWLSAVQAVADVVINEIHYNSEPNTAANEFIELHNTSTNAIDLSGWSFDGISFTFPPASFIPAGGFLVVAERPSTLLSEFGIIAFGPYQGELSGDGERIQLRNAFGVVIDEVTYQAAFPWPVGAAGTGASMELIHPSLDNDLGGSWRSSLTNSTGIPETVLLPAAATEWRYREGRSEASSPVSAWRQIDFNEDSSWITAQTPIGFGDGDDNTVIDMEDEFTSVYLRRPFVVNQIPSELILRLYVDDGAVVWINGTEVARRYVPDGQLDYDDTASSHEAAWEQLVITNAPGFLVPGTNIVAIHALNQNLSSSDFSIDLELRSPAVGATSHSLTPGAVNSVFATNAPPQTRQVGHAPNQPASGQAITISAKVTDPNGVASVSLEYQIVQPGAYVPAFLAKSTADLTANPNSPRAINPAYTNNWTAVPMLDNGAGGDALPGDDVYTAMLPGQVNRALVRYRIVAQDTLGAAVRVPYPDDDSLNFAAFVYNGVPDYAAETLSVLGAPYTHSSNVMSSVPVYHLLTDSNDFARCIAFNTADQINKNNFDARDAYNWSGTFVYDGEVYDNIGYRLRQRNSRYINPAGGKRSFNFRFNRGRYGQLRDLNGNKYPTLWDTLSTHKMTSSRNTASWGIDQVANNILWNLTGTPASAMHWFHLRVVKQPDEAPEGTSGQYFGDFYGLMLAIQDYDVRFLESQNLEKGNIYKLMSFQTNGISVQKYQAQDSVADASDFANIIFNLRPERDDAWLLQHVNYDQWYRYHAILDAVRHYDMQPNVGEHLKNAAYYFRPSTNSPFGQLWVMPWDSDTSWGPNFNGGVDFPKQAMLGYSGASPRPDFVRDYKNAVREIRDLVWTEEQIDLLLDTLRARIASIVPADRDRWTGAPTNAGAQNHPPVETVVNGMKQFAFTGGSWTGGNDSQIWDAIAKDSGISGSQGRDAYLDALADDPLIPATPTISATGPANYPVNRLSFEALNYSGANSFAAWKWRIAEVTLTNDLPLPPGTNPRMEITANWESTDITDENNRSIEIPAGAARVGATYRVRARVRDATGRWSHWSPPVQFVTTEPDSAAAQLADLKITELMFNSPGGNNFDFVELHNANPATPLDLASAKFTQGIDFTFPHGTVLPPHGYLLLIKNPDAAAFRAHYSLDTNITIVGPYAGNFDNDGELVTLRTSAGGTDIATFTYGDGRGWPLPSDGSGHSLVPLVIGDQADGALNYAGNWRASTFVNGSPGRADPGSVDQIFISEVAAHTDYPLPPPEDSNDWLELHNRGTNEFVFGTGWYLSDDHTATNLAKWMIPAGTVIPAGGFISFDERTHFHNPPTIGFGLDKAGERAVLSYLPGNTNNRVVDSVAFRGQENGWTLGRYPNSHAYWDGLPSPTRGSANQPPPLRTVITEIMYHPPDLPGSLDDTTNEFVEIFNPTASTVPLFEIAGPWRLGGGIAFTFPSNTFLSASNRIVIVSFNPTDLTQSNAFRNLYGAPPGLRLMGPWSGKLANSTDRVALEKPQEPDLPGDPISWVLVDEVLYADRTPWEQGADGIGPSLQRISLLGHGCDPSNWRAASASPGGGYGGGVPPVITTEPGPPSQIVPVGSLVDYTVIANSPDSSPLSYRWLLDNRPILAATNASLTLSNATPPDSGSYRVVVMNPSGSALSAQVNLQVRNLPAILTHPESVIAPAGTNVSFTVSASGAGTLTYAWFHNSQIITGATNSMLEVQNVQTADEGSYFATVSDLNGSSVSDPAQLTVLSGPEVIIPPQDQVVVAGEEAVFSVTSAGSLPMTYQWRRDGVPVKTETVNSHAHSLIITNAQPLQMGTYTVLLTNTVSLTGILSAGAQLTVISDSDGDGMPDVWENDNGTDPNSNDADDDPDEDGMTNLREYYAGTDPNDPQSVLRLHPLRLSASQLALQFQAMSNRSYTVQIRPSLTGAAWQKWLDISPAPTNRFLWMTNTLSSTNSFLRIVTPQQP